MSIRTYTEFLTFLVLDIITYLTNQEIVTSQSCVTSLQLMLHHCSTNWIEPDRSELSRTFHNVASCNYISLFHVIHYITTRTQ